ncbi:hypothetical protein ABMA27_014752 [Loxostege sticticalis]|uniref:Integrase catalytic domain-containing protein n=1 Tax=Loxostege sticticalis TaxID=481309 RepID=A0ABR3IA31_LOXSC
MSTENISELTGLVRKRGAVKGAITKFCNYFQEVNPSEVSTHILQIKEERLRETFKKYEELNLEVCALDPEADDSDKRALALENAEKQQVQQTTIPKATHMVTVPAGTTSMKSSTPACVLCKLPHKLFTCPKFLLLSAADRLKLITDKKLCKICLNSHTKKCRFFFKCDICKEKHNKLIHQDKPQSPVTLFTESSNKQTLLPTARVKIIASNGTEYHVKALLDSGSQVSFITKELVDLLGLQPKSISTPVVGICNNINNLNERVNVKLHSLVKDFTISTTCYLLDSIASKLPQKRFSLENLALPPNIELADQDFNIPSVIHVLLGADIFFQVLLPSEPSASLHEAAGENTSTSVSAVPVLRTQFGDVIAGSLPATQGAHQVTSLFCKTCDNTLNNTLSDFFKAESIPEHFSESLTEYDACEKIFRDTVKLDTQNNKFEVTLPLKLPLESINESLGNSFHLALKRFNNLEQRFQKDASVHQLYKDFIHDYVDQGHGTVVDISQYDISKDPVYFLPHHPVIRLDKKTTKCRVVFDGSMKTNKKVSLNDLLLNGPVVQNELLDILLLFRVDEYIFITDIKSMFRQISLNPMHRVLQNILWRDCPSDNIQCIQLNTVSYGLKSSSFLATRCLKELAMRYKDQFPLAAFIIENSIYVDDALVSQSSPELLQQSKQQLCSLLEIGGFKLHKWFSNCPELLSEVPKSQQHFDDIELQKNDAFLKTLGIHYDINTDSFMLSSPNDDNLMPATKREILSYIGKFYDPLGFAGPVVVTAKVIMQRLWQAQIAWDEQLPEHLLNNWEDFYKSLRKMSPIHLPRYVNLNNARTIELIGFADASSSTAYGCCVYLRVIDILGNVKVSLLCSKSRVNPLKQSMTVPRLELNAAVLLAKLISRVHSMLQLKLKINNVILHSDSQIVLAWIKTNINTLNAYVANRVKVILQLAQSYIWTYIDSENNPADCLSRGILPHELQNHNLWWSGPKAIHSSEYIFPVLPDLPEVEDSSAFPSAMVCTADDSNLCLDFLDKFSDITKMKRILAYVLRFIQNARSRSHRNTSDYLTSKELNDSLLLIVKGEQQKYLQDPIRDLKACKTTKGNLKQLCPFLDVNGIIRVGGRLENASIPFSHKHQVVLPRESRITHLIIQHEHIKNLHAGQRLVLSAINQKFWIVHGINEVKKVIYKCIICFKLKAQTAKQLMGSLPHDRVNFSRPFQKIGLDFAGPIMIKQSRIRKSLETKAYVCVFVCFATKAIHLELASDLRTATFLACFKRFISRRGLPTDVYSDNASTFKCASSQLTELYKLQNCKTHQKEVHDFSSQQGINFHFLPCYSPIFAGLAEAGVKSMKFHLKRVVQKSLLTYEEMNTVLCQIEAILNSRPLMPLSNDKTDFACLTPGHFLIGSALNTYPEQDVQDLRNKLQFWKVCIQIRNSFWKVWNKQYLNILQTRNKWTNVHPNLNVDSLVILKEDNTAPMFWPMARITNVFPGSDNKVRVVEVQTANGHKHRRSITKVCPLPIE